MPKKSPNMSESLVKAQENYRAKQAKAGRRKLPGCYMPDDVQAKVMDVMKTRNLGTMSEAIWVCIRGYRVPKKKK